MGDDVRDQFSRLIVGWAMSLRPTQAEVLAALRMAVTVDPDRGPFAGVPVLLRWDRGLEFAADSIAHATLVLGCVSQRTDADCPWQKGKIERLKDNRAGAAVGATRLDGRAARCSRPPRRPDAVDA